MTPLNEEKLGKYISAVNSRLEGYIGSFDGRNAPYCEKITEAMLYSLSAGGKRVRPVLVMNFAEMCGADPMKCLSAASAIEMIHTFSLIHDDLPCMDDDDMRRGKPSCHKAYGEAVALLAGDALENLAFGVVAEDGELTFEARTALVRELSRSVGVSGMIGGQVIDIGNAGGNVFSDEKILKMYSMKTSALIRCACRMGCICAGREDMLGYAGEYGEALGLAFQVTDDILDMISDTEDLGKPAGSDASLGKSTYAAIHGVDAAREFAARLTDRALNALGHFENREFAEELTEILLVRSK